MISCNFIDYSAVVGSDELPSLNVSNLTCREDFFEKNFTCLPRCDSWDDRPPSPLAMFEIIVRLAGGILDLFLNAWFLIIFTARRKAL